MTYGYYGDHLSKNLIKTEEGYLICCNVPIGRIGYMEYLGHELPEVFKLNTNDLYKVGRTEAELFRPETLMSFEGKPVTNCHPATNLDISTAAITKRGHAQNVRREGDYLIADLFIDDPMLIQEIKSGGKREVSCGYDCSWHDVGNGKFEQRDIIGNHIAVVPNGRAGPRVAIKDQKPEITGGKKMSKETPLTKRFLQALGLKHFAQDAEPEELAKAIDAFNEPEEEGKKAPEEKPVQDEEETPAQQEKEDAQMDKMATILSNILDRLEKLEAGGAQDKEPDEAEAVLDAAEVDFGKENVDVPEEEAEDAELEEKEENEKEEDKAEESPVQDAAIFKQFVSDMKPIIMAIDNEQLRVKGAKAIVKFAKDARSASTVNGYADIMKAVANNKKAAADKAAEKHSIPDNAEAACNTWKARGEQLKGGK